MSKTILLTGASDGIGLEAVDGDVGRVRIRRRTALELEVHQHPERQGHQQQDSRGARIHPIIQPGCGATTR